MEIVEKEGSEVDKILRKNLGKEPAFQFTIKGPYGRLKYLGNGSFFEYVLNNKQSLREEVQLLSVRYSRRG